MRRRDPGVDSRDDHRTDDHGTDDHGTDDPVAGDPASGDPASDDGAPGDGAPDDRAPDDHVTWDGRSTAVGALRDVLVEHAPTGALRLVLQRLALHEQGRPAGTHESIDAILDVHGNLVSMSIAAAVRSDPSSSARFERAVSTLRADVAADLEAEADSLEVVLDADGTQRVMVMLSADVSPQEVAERSHPRALHGGPHHITHHAPALDELRDRLAAPSPGPMRRAWSAVRAGLRRTR
ncbi:hypothetical protein ACT3SP_09340 [Brachybacterium sp. AOP43-C2-M15]|uniref:hypothetical protein n=1 Tax=Brachybacterium sp. AOP43-C2-M15 TaxID=3457661 RepID=UPI004034588B